MAIGSRWCKAAQAALVSWVLATSGCAGDDGGTTSSPRDVAAAPVPGGPNAMMPNAPMAAAAGMPGSASAASGGTASMTPAVAGTGAGTGALPMQMPPDPQPSPNPGEGGGGNGGDPAPPVPAGEAMESAGCGASDWPAAGEHTIDVDGTTREYIVGLPDAYDSSSPHRLIFAWHGLGGTAARIASGFGGGYYGLENRAGGTAIFVAGQGLATSSGGAGWPNSGGRDVAFVRALLDWLRASYCIDEARIFSTGMSYGGIMSNTLGCELGDVLRAIAPMAGSGPRRFGGASCAGQVAAWITHGNEDTVVSFESGLASRDHWVQTNGCSEQTVSVAPEGCLAYEGCDEGYPVHFCEFAGGHTIPSYASEAIWAFFSQF